MPSGFPAFPESRFSPDKDTLSYRRQIKTMAPNHSSDTASISSTSTFSSTVSLIKKKFTPSSSAYKSSYPSTDPNHPRWGPKSDLAEPPSKSKSKSKSKRKDDTNQMIFEIGAGAGTTVYSPYRSSYPGEFKGDFPRWGPRSDLDEKMKKGEREKEEEERKREKKEKKRADREKMMAERKRMDREMVRFPYTAMALMKP